MKEVDLFLFMGQSNMAGRGVPYEKKSECVPEILPGSGLEYRAVTKPNSLSPIEEPFGKDENRMDGINDGNKKTGSLVTSFVNSYYHCSKVPIVGISASEGGTSILQWQPGGRLLEDAKSRLSAGIQFLKEKKYNIRHIFMLWCQGETDGDNSMEPQKYQKYFERMLDDMINSGIEMCFLIGIGQYNGEKQISYEGIINIQKNIANENKHVILVSSSFAEMKERDGMKDDFHYYQWVYNEIGKEAGRNTAIYTNSMG